MANIEISRDIHLQKLISAKHDGLIKIITGIRRCGKSYLLNNIFCNHLHSEGIDDAHIIKIDLENRRIAELRNPDNLIAYIDSRMTDDKMYYILLDEVQRVDQFEDVLNSYLCVKNADVYATGSNSQFLSKDIITTFRGRSEEIRMAPLNFTEYCSIKQGDPATLLHEYMMYGGMPKAATMTDEAKRKQYLRDLVDNVYLRDIKERYNIDKDAELLELINVIASNIGCLTNAKKIEHTFKSKKNVTITDDTIRKYLQMLEDAFLVNSSIRYDIKGKNYINTPLKYYFSDLGLRNARLNFRQIEYPHLLENCIYNELLLRGLSVDVGQLQIVARHQDKVQRETLEVDFVCNQNYKRYYIQVAYAMPTEEKKQQEMRPLQTIDDSFKKIIIVGTPTPTYQTEDGIVVMSVYDFLAKPDSLSI
ncbi:MAG: ATP-binding protein [Prevotella sp.]|jgi:predicted AAA+ superfamily ATPase